MRDPAQSTRVGHRTAFAATLLTVLAVFIPMLVRGEVLLADPVSDEISARLAKVNDSERTRSFRDQHVVYLPALEHQLHGARSGWLATWVPTVEQGRAPWHLSGFTKAFVLTHVLSWWIDDAFWLYTALALAAVLACAAFGYGLLHSLDLTPAACYAGAVGLALGVYVCFWLTFALYVWGVAWALAILWLAPGVLERRGFGRALGLAFCVHALLMTSYPQQTVWTAWLVVMVLAWHLVRMPGGAPARVAGLARLALCGVVGLVSVLPVYLDLAQAASVSSRSALAAQYFLDPLPALAGLAQWGEFLARLFDASWFGDPVDHEYPFRIKGVSLTPLFALLFAASFACRGLARARPWQVFAGLTFLVTVAPPVYRFGIEHLGLGVSRHAPMAALHVPLMVVAALAADHVLRSGAGRRVGLLALAAVPVVIAALGVWFADAEVVPWRVGLSGVALAGTLVFLARPRPLWLVGLVLLTIGTSSYGLILSVPRASALAEHDFAREVQGRTQPGERYLWIGDRFRYLVRPNQEVLFGLASVHTYNSLCSTRYEQWAARISADGLEAGGKQFRRLDSAARLDAETLALAGVGLVISGVPIDQPFLTESGRLKLLTFYAPELPPLLEALFTSFELDGDEAGLEPAAIRAATGPGASRVERTRDEGDLLEFEVAASAEPTLLFVGQQWHANWRASVASASGEVLRPARCVPVEGLYQGVLLPPGTTRVRLEFRPWVRWSWVPQLLFALAGLVAGVRALATRGRGPADPAGTSAS